MAPLITPRLLKGFRDFLPSQQRIREALLAHLTPVLARHGFLPIDTPLLEYSEILLGKGGGETEKQVYRFLDQGGRDVALRFDLTIPLARFVAQHAAELDLPFRCYHFGKVFRGENTQRGRYREFIQFDFDIVGSHSAITDFEILQIVVDLFTALQLETTIYFSHSQLIPAFINHLAPNTTLQQSILPLRIIIDKIPKIGIAGATQRLTEVLPVDEHRYIPPLLELITMGTHHPSRYTLDYITQKLPRNTQCAPLIEYLELLVGWAEKSGCTDTLVLAPHITRGLDYYTALLFETFSLHHPQIGSLCSGGRYDNLASLYTAQHYPGVGGSIGVDRLLALETTLPLATPPPPDLLITTPQNPHAERPVPHQSLPAETENQRIQWKHQLRSAELFCQLYPHRASLGAQLQYAERHTIAHSLIPTLTRATRSTSSEPPPHYLFEVRNHHRRISIPCSRIESVIALLTIYRHNSTLHSALYQWAPSLRTPHPPDAPHHTDTPGVAKPAYQRLVHDIVASHTQKPPIKKRHNT